MFGQISTMAQRIEPTIRNKPIIAGNTKPGNKNNSTIIKDTPRRKTRTSSCPAKPETYFEPKKIKTKTIPAIQKKPKPGVLNSINNPSSPIPIIIGPMELSHNPTFSAQFISIFIKV